MDDNDVHYEGSLMENLCHEKAEPARKIGHKRNHLLKENIRAARVLLGNALNPCTLDRLECLTQDFGFSLRKGDLTIIAGSWYVTHQGLLSLARRRRCLGIQAETVDSLCDCASKRYVLKASVYPSTSSSGFVGFGDADPSNVSALVQGAEMRVAETRAVNRALRKAYGIGICSVEELGLAKQDSVSNKLPPQPANGNGLASRRVRDQLCQLIRQHQLDPVLVKSYATEFCGVKALREASREQIESFVTHLGEWADKDRNALLCQLNSYLGPKEGAA